MANTPIRNFFEGYQKLIRPTLEVMAQNESDDMFTLVDPSTGRRLEPYQREAHTREVERRTEEALNESKNLEEKLEILEKESEE